MTEQEKIQREIIIEDLNRVEILIENGKKQMAHDLIMCVVADIKSIK